MRPIIAICTLLLAVSFAEAQDRTFPTYRSPNQKQADYIRSQQPRRVVVPTARFRQPIYAPGFYEPGFGYGYGYRYPYYRRGFRPVYPVYPPVVRPWPVTPYPFRLP